MATKNTYRVPKTQWDKWSDVARHTFNCTYNLMHDAPDLFMHPKQEAPKLEYWKTTCWNAAWTAADAATAAGEQNDR